MSDFVIMECEPGDNIDHFAAMMIARAWVENKTVLGEFNQFTLEARPGMMTDDVMRPWNNYQRKSYENR